MILGLVGTHVVGPRTHRANWRGGDCGRGRAAAERAKVTGAGLVRVTDSSGILASPP